jgi:CDP-glycerol glycerophosphotransferase
MLKKIAMNRPKFRPRAAIATIRERARWDILLSENPYSSRIFRSAYAYFGPIWEEGYPRNDVLRRGDGAGIRRKLGIPDDVTVLLYAPTWRDNRPEQVDHLDVAAFARTLGPGYLTLIRGHSRTLRPGHDVYAANVLDVTSYPDVSELFLVADALITDYSSVMFDYTVTGKPVFFFVPDLDDYRTKLRGFYFDLIEAAPGPVVRTAGELVSLIRDRDQLSTDYARKYADWQKRFNPRDDGEASGRVVRRLLAQRMIG